MGETSGFTKENLCSLAEISVLPPSSSSSTPSRRDERRERELGHRRADILAAATAVFARKGFHDAQVAEIASEAELSLKSVYALFDGKVEIYNAVVSTTAERMREVVQSKVQAIPDPAERLLSLIDLLFDCFEENRDLFQIYVRTAHGLPWRIRQGMGEQAHSILHAFTEWVVALSETAKSAGYLDGIDARAFALALVGAVTTTATDWLEKRGEQPLSRAAPALRAILAAALSGEADERDQ